ncbi:MAG: Lrp/AsnC ligand binding domain-containing protein [Pseudomonadales bacterium]|nr:Lrp/AsnC ligand binding domain-containing protein [Pseudomonadales bacterium]NRA15354.1 Lrp/AsnC ligand binding domain-containing protein [Oceanospirillaceae bacterium]
MSDLDKFDKAIIRELQKNSRISVTDLAKIVGLSKTPCKIRMDRLEQQGYILGYSLLVDRAKLGESHVAFVQVTLSDTKTEALQAFNKAVRLIPEVEQCHMTAASFDYLLKVRTTDMSSYRKFLGETLSNLPYVLHSSTYVVMESIKDQ